jgi:hypothetical protein
MRKDVKTGMLAGTVLCLVFVVWFCAKQQIIVQPVIKFESLNNEIIEPKNDVLPVTLAQSAERFNVPTYEPVQPQSQKTQKPDDAEALVFHIVAQGQTLSNISNIYYNTPYRWKKIYEANKEQFPKGPDAITPGMKLAIPQ